MRVIENGLSFNGVKHPLMHTLAALIFDVDGTLADNECDGHRVAFNQAFAEAGLDWYWDAERYGELLQIMGGKERIRYYLSQDWPQRLHEPDIDEQINRLHAAKTHHYVALLKTGAIPLRPGVQRLLEQARQNDLRLAIATTTTLINVTTLLRTTLGEASIDWFEVIAAGDVVPVKKPAPDIYQYALKALNLPPSACLALEDSANGLRAARAAGIPVVVVNNAYTQDEDFSGALAVLDGFGDPETPATVISGAAPMNGYVDIPSLRAWHHRR